MNRLYERLVACCHRPNHFNRLHIALENRLTSVEFVQLLNLIMSRYGSTQSATWIEGLNDLFELSGKSEPEEYFRKRIGPHLYLFSDGRPTDGKTLIIGFAGGAGRLMMPVSILLQHLRSADADLLLVYHRGTKLYSEGVAGLAKDFGELIAILKTVIEKKAYRRRVAFGTSVGGLPALLATLYLDLDRGVSVGGASLEPGSWARVLDDPQFKNALARWNGRPELLSIFSEQNQRDRDAALDLQTCLPLALWPVPDDQTHNPLYKILKSGKMSRFLSTTLMDDWNVCDRVDTGDARHIVDCIQSSIDILRSRER